MAFAHTDEDAVARFTETGWLLTRTLADDGVAELRSWVDEVSSWQETDGELIEVASALLGEPALLYKEKINYKLPGGAGYSPHQDTPAYRFVDVHVSCMVAVDDATVHNGCLEVVSGAHGDVLPTDDRGCIRAAWWRR